MGNAEQQMREILLQKIENMKEEGAPKKEIKRVQNYLDTFLPEGGTDFKVGADELPAVLSHPRGSISMVRALKQIRDLLLVISADDDTPASEDRINASIDDVETMLESLGWRKDA